MALTGMPMPLPQTTSLEVTVVSGESVLLRSGRTLSRGAYTVVRTVSSSAVTHVNADADCGGYPRWNETLCVELPAGARGIDVEICRTNGGRAGEPVAATRVPVADFSVGPPGHLHCLSYRLYDAGGAQGRNGIVNITVKRLGGEGRKASLQVPGMGKAVDAGASSCYSVGDQGTVPASGVAIGYPVGVDFSATRRADAGDKGCV